MQRLKMVCLCALLASLAFATCEAALLLRSARRATDAMPSAVSGQIDSIELALAGQLTAIRADTIALIDKRTGQALSIVDRRAGDTLARLDTLSMRADAQLTTINAVARDLSVQTAATLAGVRSDLQPTFTEAQTLLATSNRTVADLHPQLLGLVAASKVTAGETAQTMREVKNAAPKMVDSVEHIAASADGIAADAKLEADEVTKPKKWWQKILGPLYTVARLIALVF